MKCQRCNKELIFEESILKEFVACPYCGTFFPKILPPIEAGTIEAELKKFVDDFGGLEIFSEENSSRFSKSLVKLEAPFDVARDKLLVANIKNIPQKLYSVLDQPQNEQQQMADLCLDEMTSFGLPQEFAKETISWLAHVMGFACDFANVDDENTFIDERDGQKYRIVQIGNQIWMAENLNFEIDDSFEVCSEDFENEKCGRFYSEKSVRRACPEGWHLPTREEVEILIEFVGGKKVAGKMLKAKNGWKGKGNDGLDKFNFSALPVGMMSNKNNSKQRRSYQECACFWTNTFPEDSDYTPYYLEMLYEEDYIILEHTWREFCMYYSVRCIKD